jgi:GxxExxY protein
MTRRRPNRSDLIEKDLTGEIIGAFFDCYNWLGFGFLESVYRRALVTELRAKGLRAVEEAPTEVLYKGVCVGTFKLDLLVEERVIVEAKATSALGPTGKRQWLNYLRATNLEVGLLLHFGPEPRFLRCVHPKVLHSGPRYTAADESDPAFSASSV